MTKSILNSSEVCRAYVALEHRQKPRIFDWEETLEWGLNQVTAKPSPCVPSIIENSTPKAKNDFMATWIRLGTCHGSSGKIREIGNSAF